MMGFVKLRKYVRHHDFDYIIDFRSRRRFLVEFVFSYFVIPNFDKVIYTCHLPLLSKYFPKPWRLFRGIYNRSKKIVCVSEGIEQKANEIGFHNSQVILNAIDFNFIDKQVNVKKTFDFKFIIGVGRMDDNIKQFDHLMSSYSKSELPKNNIHLLILGQGPYQPNLEAYKQELSHNEKIHFVGFQKNPFKFMSEALFFVLSSKFEGYPMVLLESLACGIPVISYDCPTGPSEIIKHRENGILVPHQNMDKLTDAMDEFVEDIPLYEYCKSNSIKSVAHLSMENIGREWAALLKSH